jgi:hypothetical protein
MKYANIHDLPEDSSEVSARKRVIKAFNGIWDGTDEHALAIVRIMNALEGMRPSKKRANRRRV